MDSENKSKSFGVGGYRGRIIFLGDGTEVLTDSDDTEMFDNADEDKDLESQVSKSSSSTEPSKIEASAPATNPSDSSKPSDVKPSEDAEKKTTDSIPEPSKKD